MGYDMSTVEPMTAEDQAEFDEAKAKFEAAVKIRDAYERGSEEAHEAQEAVTEAYELMSETDKNYFRYNIWGMGRCRSVMADLGMMKHPAAGSWPEMPSELEGQAGALYDYTDDGVDQLDTPTCRAALPWLTDELVALWRTYRADIEKYLSEHDRDTPGIAENKFSSNDGWHVTPGECVGAVGMFKRASDGKKRAAYDAAELNADGVQYFEQWVKWLEYCSTRGGFKVY